MYLHPCEILFDETNLKCPSPCYADNITLYSIDWIVNTISPIVIIILANLGLVIRLVHSMRKIRSQRRLIWKRQKKLTIQLLTFSSLHTIVWTPSTVIAILQTLVFPNLYNDIPQIYDAYYMIYFLYPLQSFSYLLALPDVMKFLKSNVKRIFARATITPLVTVSSNM